MGKDTSNNNQQRSPVKGQWGWGGYLPGGITRSDRCIVEMFRNRIGTVIWSPIS